MRTTGLRTQLKLLPLLICCLSGPLVAAETQPFVVSPDLIRGGGGKKQRSTTLPPAQNSDDARKVEERSSAVQVRPVREQAPVIVEPAAAKGEKEPEAAASTFEEAAPAKADASANEQEPSGSAHAAQGLRRRDPDSDAGAAGGYAPKRRQHIGLQYDSSEEGLSAGHLATSGNAGGQISLENGATEISAAHIKGTQSVGLVAIENAELRRNNLNLTGDRLSYNELTDTAKAEGNVTLLRGRDSITGPSAWLHVGEQVGEFESPTYQLTGMSRPGEVGEQPYEVTAHGRGDRLYLEGENQYRLDNGTWTTCSPSNSDWYIKAKQLELDYDTDQGLARGSTLVFKDVPILWWPKMGFPLAEQRQSGFLVPKIEVTNKTGIDISVPYYWNIAPNYDATIAPRYMARRGVQLAGEMRYLTSTNMGQFRTEWLPNDNVSGETRTLYSLQHQQALAPRLTAYVDYNSVSDKKYFEDLSSRLALTSKDNLVREGRLNYSGDWWNASLMAQRYQTLSGWEPYRRLPQLKLQAHREDMPFGAVFSMENEYTKFEHQERGQAEGKRFTAHPSLAFPFVRPSYYITPKIGVHYSKYDLDTTLEGGRDSIRRTIPITSLDTGMFFERDTHFFNNDYQQTLEPRLFYVYAPYRDQEDIPIFDTARYDFGFAQIFSENGYSGEDRISDANQVTAAVTSRLINPASGAEVLRATVGQRFYFTDQRVSLNQLGQGRVEHIRDRSRTDWLAALQGQVSQRIYMDSAWQYNPDENQTERFNMAVRYKPDFAKMFNVSYRYYRDVLKDLDVSSQWPLTKNLYGVTRLTRSLKDGRFTEALAGIEYMGGCGCWIFRTAVHRFATNEKEATKALFFQLELKGLGGIGPSPISLSRRSVPGYGRIGNVEADQFFSE